MLHGVLVLNAATGATLLLLLLECIVLLKVLEVGAARRPAE